MNEVTQEELKEIQVSLLDNIDLICRKNNIRYSLAYGTLIGAMRHKGFIPWDDDIDIMMPRQDYTKFIEICNNSTVPFDLLCLQTDNSFGCLFAKISHKDTVLIEEYTRTTNANLGVYVDIFPIDYLGNTKDEAIKNYKSVVFLKTLFDASIWKHYRRSKRRAIYYEPFRLALYFCGKLINTNQLGKYIECKINNFSTGEMLFSGCVAPMYGIKDIYPTPIFDMDHLVDFENKKYPAINNYDQYLTSIYGEYMKLPPIEKRKTHHDFKAYWK